MTIQDFVKSGRPLQVMFFDGEGMCPGIMHGDTIICACCGGVYEVRDVLEAAIEASVEPIRLFNCWVDLSTEIKGDNNDWRQFTVGFEEDV